MGARRKNFIAHRRRTDDDGEEDGDLAPVLDDDSSSHGSIASDLDEDADAEGSESSETGTPNKPGPKRRVNDKSGKLSNGNAQGSADDAQVAVALSAKMADTEAMLNGMNITENDITVEELQFDGPEVSLGQPIDDQSALAKPESLIDKRRREHEEYKKKRDSDPSFVPNRGGFFMHDHRSSAPGQNGFRPSGRGRGRGRGGVGGTSSPLSHGNQQTNPADAPWSHDLHDTVSTEDVSKTEAPKPAATNAVQKPAAPPPPQRAPPPNRTFSRTSLVGNTQLRVSLPGMQSPILFSAVPVHQHTRLPHHRPPLRRDKPVRISLPDQSPRYIFPAVDRSFIFIPRALRPNQQGFHRGRGRGSFGGYSYASGRNSIYGGSVYTPSVAMSRRSSFARELGRDNMVSPAGSVMSRTRSIADANKPVVRLPPAEGPFAQPHYQQSPFVTAPAPVVNLPVAHVYPLPQNPMSTEGISPNLQMHQPRPQKAVSVAGIESPAGQSHQGSFQPPQQQLQQPFHQQVPINVNGQGFPTDPNVYPHSRHPSHPSQHGTPLSQIPERAIHAQPFQPFPFQQAYYPQQYPGPVYFYPSPAPHLGAPAFVPDQQYPYTMPATPSVMPEPTTQAGTVAHESNGTVYYYDTSQLVAGTDDPSAYSQMAYAAPNGYMMAQPAVFYPSTPQ